MNLEYDADELSLLAQFARVIEELAPVQPGVRARDESEVWPRLVQAGWADIGENVERDELSLGLAVGLFRLAGQRLVVEEFVSSAYLLSALITHLPPGDDGDLIRGPLRLHPGVLLGDGRESAIPVVAADVRTGYCFGASELVNVYRVLDGPCGLVLSRWQGARPEIEWTGNLSRGVGRLFLAGEQWSDVELTATPAQLERIAANAMLLHSAGLIGLAEEVLELTCSYVQGRVQFDAPIGSYQAVKHELADTFAFNSVAWNAVLSAAAEGADAHTAPQVARYLAVEATLGAARAAAQFHGGMGFTSELSLHLYLKAALDGAQRFGSHDDYAAKLGQALVQAAC